MSKNDPLKKHYAYYSSEWIWPSSDAELIKLLLLFFDGITLSLPSNLFLVTLEREPILAESLYERGLLLNTEPSQALNRKAAEHLTRAIYEAVRSSPRRAEAVIPDMLCSPHFGHWKGTLAQRLFAELERSGLATLPGTDELLEINPEVKLIVLYLYAQVLHYSSRRALNYIIEPVDIDRTELLTALMHGQQARYAERYGLDQVRADASRVEAAMLGTFISNELRVPVDLTLATLDDILEFREHNGRDLRNYMNALKRHVAEMATSDNPAALAEERALELEDYNASLRARTNYKNVRAGISIGISAAASAWTAGTGNLGGAVFALLSALAGIPRNEALREVNSYSYLTRVSRRFG